MVVLRMLLGEEGFNIKPFRLVAALGSLLFPAPAASFTYVVFSRQALTPDWSIFVLRQLFPSASLPRPWFGVVVVLRSCPTLCYSWETHAQALIGCC